MKAHFVSLALIGALVAVFVAAPLSASAQVTPNGPFQVNQSPVFNQNGAQVGTFTGTVSNLVFTTVNDQLRVAGRIQGTVTRTATGVTQSVNEAFGSAPAGIPSFPFSCKILNLNIGRINLDLLGLIVDIAPIRIDISAQPGGGNLLGNLLCAIVNLLNP